MSDLRIALVAEGPTDAVILEAALKAILQEPFILTQLQPEATRPDTGTGWGGVVKWCHRLSQRHQGSTEQDPTLIDFDLLIIHLDVDVSTFDYRHCGANLSQLAQECSWECLPCAEPCPPVEGSCNALRNVLESWLAPSKPGAGTVLCLPAQSSGTWLASAVLPTDHRLLDRAECNLQVESGLEQLPKNQRIKKKKREYQLKAPLITSNWHAIKSVCSQASVFESEVLIALGR
jgi:hypothetical protein